MSRNIPSCVPHFSPVLGINLPAAVVAAPCIGFSPDPSGIPGCCLPFPWDLEQSWSRVGRVEKQPWLVSTLLGPAGIVAAAVPDWQGLRNVSTGAQVGPGLPVAAPSPAKLCPAWLCPEKLVQLQCPCPIHPAVLAAHWCGPLGRDCGGGVCRMFPLLPL